MTTKDMTKREDHVQTFAPACDVLENRDEYLIVADLPGVDPNTVEIQFHNGELTLRAPRTGSGVDLFSGTKTGYEFARRFRIPGGIDAEKIIADLKHGVLSLHLPKEEARKPRQIAVTQGT